MSKQITVNIDENLHGRKIEYILEKHLKLSNNLIGKIKRAENSIMLNGRSAKTINTVNCGDTLTVNVPIRDSKNIEGVNIPIDVIYEDCDILAVNKPRSMPVHPSRSHVDDTLANALKYYLEGKGQGFHIITRLDKDTSGVVLVAKNPISAQRLTDSMKSGRIKKEYIAVVNGVPSPERGSISAPIRKADCEGIRRIVSPDGKEALTEYEVIKANSDLSLVRLWPITGRTHQLRVHMSYLGHPIYGDGMYGAPQKGEKTRLHCCKLLLRHPFSGENIVVKAPLAEDFECGNFLFTSPISCDIMLINERFVKGVD